MTGFDFPTMLFAEDGLDLHWHPLALLLRGSNDNLRQVHPDS